MIALDQLTRAYFEPFVGQPFTCSDGKISVPLTLAKVRPLPVLRPEVPREPFALEFQGPPTLRAPQGTYRFVHPTLGTMEIFIVQTGAGANSSQFEAIFS